MIVKVPTQRRDKRTSFGRLVDYITEGLPTDASDVMASVFDDVTQYITAETALDEMGDDVDKTLAVQIGNLTSIRTAAAEMGAVASMNKRVLDPVFHYIISWPENERPAVEEVFDAARMSLAALGVLEHQYVIAIHVNTDNLHAHIAFNRVHPKTFKSQHLSYYQEKMHEAARHAEIKYGWKHDNGLFKVIEVGGEKIVVPNKDSREHSATKLSTRAADYEAWSGIQSFESWCHDVPAKAIKKAFDAKKITTWHDVHTYAAQYGIEVERVGTGLRIRNNDGAADDKGEFVPASRVMRFLNLKKLEKDFGAFIPASEAVKQTQPVHRYKRDPIKRLIRKEERRALREDLYERYQQDKASNAVLRGQGRHTIRDAARKELDLALKNATKQYRDRRAKLQSNARISGLEKQQQYTVLRLQHLQVVTEIRRQHKVALKNLLTELPSSFSWRTWVEQQAQLGDEAAISALRGIVYRERRQHGDTQELEPQIGERIDDIPSIRPAGKSAEDAPTIKPLARLQWQVTTNGRIIYRLRRQNESPIAFIDEGRRLVYSRRTVDTDSLSASLEYARMKWGDNITLTGGDDVFKRRVVEAAVAIGMRVSNPELFEHQIAALNALPQRQRSGRPSTDSEVQRMLKVSPSTKFSHAEHAINGSRYAGTVLSVTDTHVMMQVAPHSVVLHPIDRLLVIPKARKQIAVEYKNGKGEVTQGKGRSGR